MTVETELKLRIAPDQFERLKRHRLFKQFQITPPVTQRLHNIYFDTPDLALHVNRTALRLRRVGGEWLQTLKGGGSIKAGLHQRNEWELPSLSGKLDYSLLEETVQQTFLPPSLFEKLEPVFVTDFYRTSRLLDWQGTKIEVCMDRGTVKTKHLSQPICELELELKSGDPLHLFEFALEILEIVPFELEAVSKAEQGFRLMSGHVDLPAKAIEPVIDENEKLTDVLQALLWSCMQHLQQNLRGASESQDAEFLHQMRVALRRMRVVLRMAENILSDDTLSLLRQDIAILGSKLGEMREWDVFIDGVAQPLCSAYPSEDGLAALLAIAEQQRAGCGAALRAELHTRDLQRVMLRFSIWMNGNYWAEAEQVKDIAVRKFSGKLLRRLHKRFQRAASLLESLDSARLHQLRIIAKKLRYSTEFFASLYPGKKTALYSNALSELQDLLGQNNDFVIAHHLLAHLASLPALSCHPESIKLAGKWLDKHCSIKFGKLEKAVAYINDKSIFWEE